MTYNQMIKLIAEGEAGEVQTILANVRETVKVIKKHFAADKPYMAGHEFRTAFIKYMYDLKPMPDITTAKTKRKRKKKAKKCKR